MAANVKLHVAKLVRVIDVLFGVEVSGYVDIVFGEPEFRNEHNNRFKTLITQTPNPSRMSPTQTCLDS
jgi:hypothetical protein